MTVRQLTRIGSVSRLPRMGQVAARRYAKKAATAGLAALALSGCVTVNAPSEPIVIELNVNIRQEVIYRLAADAGKTIEDNGDIF